MIMGVMEVVSAMWGRRGGAAMEVVVSMTWGSR